MTLDRFDPSLTAPFAGYDEREARRFYARVNKLAELMHVRVRGLENIPKGRALLVGNHTFGWDAMFPMAAIARHLKRRVWVLGEHAWWKVPFVRRFVASVGVVDGSPANVDRLLQSEELVLVLPGGLREAIKPRELRYQLLWGNRYGFVRAALRNQAPLVPLASVGSDELFDLVGNAYERGARWFGRWEIPFPVSARVLPRRVRSAFRVGEPIEPGAGPEAESDFAYVRQLRQCIEGALHELIEEELAKRMGIDLT